MKPPPPLPPRDPPPPNPPPPPFTPFPPGLPPQFGNPIRVFSPLAFEVPEADEDGLFSIKCAVEHCGNGLPVFKSSSRIGIISKINEMAESGVIFQSACAYECSRTLVSHALNLDDFTQLFTTSTFPRALFSYPRLSDKQEVVVGDDTQSANLGTSSTAEGYTQLQEIGRLSRSTMTECGEFIEDRKTIAMHAVWMYNHTEVGMLPVGECVLFLASRNPFQTTLWDSFFEHARRVVSIAHFEHAVPSALSTAAATPRSGLDCNFGYSTPPQGESQDDTTDTTWRACVWWSEFNSDSQDDLACSPDRVRYILNPFKHTHLHCLSQISIPYLSGRLEYNHAQQDAFRTSARLSTLPASLAAPAAASADEYTAASTRREFPVCFGHTSSCFYPNEHLG